MSRATLWLGILSAGMLTAAASAAGEPPPADWVQPEFDGGPGKQRVVARVVNAK